MLIKLRGLQMIKLLNELFTKEHRYPLYKHYTQMEYNNNTGVIGENEHIDLVVLTKFGKVIKTENDWQYGNPYIHHWFSEIIDVGQGRTNEQGYDESFYSLKDAGKILGSIL